MRYVATPWLMPGVCSTRTQGLRTLAHVRREKAVQSSSPAAVCASSRAGVAWAGATVGGARGAIGHGLCLAVALRHVDRVLQRGDDYSTWRNALSTPLPCQKAD